MTIAECITGKITLIQTSANSAKVKLIGINAKSFKEKRSHKILNNDTAICEILKRIPNVNLPRLGIEASL